MPHCLGYPGRQFVSSVSILPCSEHKKEKINKKKTWRKAIFAFKWCTDPFFNLLFNNLLKMIEVYSKVVYDVVPIRSMEMKRSTGILSEANSRQPACLAGDAMSHGAKHLFPLAPIIAASHLRIHKPSWGLTGVACWWLPLYLLRFALYWKKYLV